MQGASGFAAGATAPTAGAMGSFGGASGMPGFDMSGSMGMNPYFFGYPGGMGGMMPSWLPGEGSAAAFKAPGAKNEIKLFVGGL